MSSAVLMFVLGCQYPRMVSAEIFSRDLSQDNKKCYPRTVITLLQSCLLAPLPTWGQFHSQHLGSSL